MRTPFPASAAPGHGLVDLGLAPHVDAAGGLVEEEHVRLLVQEAGEGHLLLVAAGEGPHRLAGVAQAHVELARPLR